MEAVMRVRILLAGLLWALGAAAVLYAAAGWDAVSWEWASKTLGGLAFGAVGLLLAIKTRVVTGWLFLVGQLLMAFGLGLIETNETETLFLAAAILLTFPSGRLPSRRWMWAVWLLALSIAVWVTHEVVAILPEEGWEWLVGLGGPTVVMVASAGRIFDDYRRSVGQTRQQLKWLAWVLMVGAMTLALSLIPLPYIDDANELAGLVLIVGSPIAIGIAVSKYRLYDVDRVVSRTVTYGVVVGLLAAAVALLSTLIGIQFQNPLVVAATTLGVAAAFNPLRRRVQAAVDRRFNRAKYDHERIADQFTATLRDDVDLEGLLRGWVDVVAETMQPTGIGLWMRVS